MKRGLAVAVAAVALLGAGISGCSSDKSSTGSGETSSSPGTTPVITDTTSAAPGGTSWNITLNGEALPQGDGSSKVTCGRGTPISGPSRGKQTINIKAGPGRADLVEGPLQVASVRISDGTGAYYLYDPSQAARHVGGGDAQVTEEGESYKITGHIALELNGEGKTQKDATPVPFEFEATCP